MADDSTTVVQELHAHISHSLAGKHFTVALVGAAGVGKSTLVNTLLMKKVCEVGRGAVPVTAKATVNPIALPLQGGGEVTLHVVDSPGFTGERQNDRMATECLQALGVPDLLLICFALDSDSGRYLHNVHGAVLEKIAAVPGWGVEMMRKRAMIVLTKCNLVSDAYQKGAHQSASCRSPQTFEEEVKQWKEAFASSQDDEIMATLPVSIAGRLEFGRDGRPSFVSAIDGRTAWFQDMWNAVANRTDGGLAPVLYLSANATHQDPSLDAAIRQKLPVPDKALLTKVLRFASSALSMLVKAGGSAGNLCSLAGIEIDDDVAQTIFDGLQQALEGAADESPGEVLAGVFSICNGLVSYWKSTPA